MPGGHQAPLERGTKTTKGPSRQPTHRGKSARIRPEVGRMKAWVAVTDREWFRYLGERPAIDEVNFWQPGGAREFRILSVGQPLLFKLHYPDHFVARGGFFRHATRLPVSLAWETFEGQTANSSSGTRTPYSRDDKWGDSQHGPRSRPTLYGVVRSAERRRPCDDAWSN
jgi:hypothetical protein